MIRNFKLRWCALRWGEITCKVIPITEGRADRVIGPPRQKLLWSSMEPYYVVERETTDNEKIVTRVIAGPFETLDEAENVLAEFGNKENYPQIWYDVWDKYSLEVRGYL